MKVLCLRDVYEGRGLIGGKEYDVISIEKGWYRVVSELNEDYLFPPQLFKIIEDVETDLKAEDLNLLS